MNAIGQISELRLHSRSKNASDKSLHKKASLWQLLLTLIGKCSMWVNIGIMLSIKGVHIFLLSLSAFVRYQVIFFGSLCHEKYFPCLEKRPSISLML